MTLTGSAIEIDVNKGAQQYYTEADLTDFGTVKLASEAAVTLTGTSETTATVETVSATAFSAKKIDTATDIAKLGTYTATAVVPGIIAGISLKDLGISGDKLVRSARFNVVNSMEMPTVRIDSKKSDASSIDALTLVQDCVVSDVDLIANALDASVTNVENIDANRLPLVIAANSMANYKQFVNFVQVTDNFDGIDYIYHVLANTTFTYDK